MKNMYWQCATALLFSVCVISCSKGKDPVPDVPVRPEALLDSVVEKNTFYNSIYHFEYNPQGALAALHYVDLDPVRGYDYDEYYAYNSKHQLAYVSGDASEPPSENSFIWRFRYNASGQQLMIDPGDNEYRDSVILNSNKQLIRRYKYRQNELQFADTLTWSGNNVVKINTGVFSPGSLPARTLKVFKYDDKKNPYASAAVIAMYQGMGEHIWMSANNVTEIAETYINSYDNQVGGVNATTITYKYNDNGYPISSVANIITNDYPTTTTKQYTYKK
ncbi:hypothetical protein CLV59_109176 [Chitinophaga dinghuensis]|uniref:Uncharacterized protein n=1 Tax=Chitinophaga dinghuensis TaxID=1539050 RepID=A0A327VM28_9BACT|nr:hypothetical protein [Chitinophaga dinghuensis]RAJ75562.1 hypothetical protein CLV59_109176 [Chitinophaga dinghuensis]